MEGNRHGTLRQQFGRILAVLLILASYAFTRLPELSEYEREQLAERFSFQSLPLFELPKSEIEYQGVPYKYQKVRQVSPQLDDISAWISSVGASVALNDLDGNGLSDDICWVDARVDQVIVAPVPGSGDRYPPQVLKPFNKYDLRLMSVDTTDDLVGEGLSLVVVALVGTDLHIRIFDASGKKVIEKAENELESGEKLTALKQRLNLFPAEFSLSQEEKQEIIRNATSIAGHTLNDLTMAPMGCLPGDLNEDGAIDLLVYYWGRPPIAYLRDTASDSNILKYIPEEIYPGQERWFTNAATLSDIDGDGHVDLIIGNYFPDDSRILDPNSTDAEAMQHSMSRAYNAGRNRLLLWAKPGKTSVRFEEAEDAFDNEVMLGWTLAVGTADLDGDLLPEIYFGNDFGPDRLLHNLSTPGKPAFRRLIGEKRFDLPKSLALGRDSFKGMGIDFGDINGDGLLDIYVSNIATEFGLQESHFLWLSTGDLAGMAQGRAPYVHGSEKLGLSRSGWGWESRLADFDNDGVLEGVQATGFIKGEINRWPELQALGTSNDELLSDLRFWPFFQPGVDLSGHEANSFFVRASDGRYYDVATELGLGEPVVTRGIATADVDGDGDLDFVFGNQWERSVFYRNDCPDCKGFLGLHLMLPVTTAGMNKTLAQPGHPCIEQPTPPANGEQIKHIDCVEYYQLARPAIGASATLHLPDGRRLVAQVDGGNGHSGSRSPEIHFGLDDTPNDVPLRLEVKWRDSNGVKNAETFNLTSGWHTLYLATAGRS